MRRRSPPPKRNRGPQKWDREAKQLREMVDRDIEEQIDTLTDKFGPNFTIALLISKARTGDLIGRKGANISALERISSAKIDVERGSSRYDQALNRVVILKGKL